MAADAGRGRVARRGDPLADVPVARRRTEMLLGYEQTDVPPGGLERVDAAMAIPIIGTGARLNLALVGSPEALTVRRAGLDPASCSMAKRRDSSTSGSGY